MKNKMNVLKKEAKQICFNEGNKFIPNHYGLKDNKDNILCIYNSILIFDFGFLTCLDYDSIYENYKDYEWRLTDLKDLEQGDICKVIYKCLPKLYIYVFDKITEHYIYVGDEDYEHKTCALMWGIEDNRPVKDYPFENVYKLFKKEMK